MIQDVSPLPAQEKCSEKSFFYLKEKTLKQLSAHFFWSL